MVYTIHYGEISDAWNKSWGEVDDDYDSPYCVLAVRHEIHDRLSFGWLGFLEWAEEHFKDEYIIDISGAFAWKCRGEDLLCLNDSGKAVVEDIDSIVPDKIYGVVFVEEP